MDKYSYFKQRLDNHISKVNRSVQKLVSKYPEYKALTSIAKNHDKSKYKGVEYEPYVEITWLRKTANGYMSASEELQNEIDDATIYHIQKNPHHPEFWYSGKNSLTASNRFNKKMNVENMPNIAIAEMVCDWQAMGEELGNTARSWYNKTKNIRWKFSKEQDVLIDKFLKVFE